ncbi:hypothetical protein A2125_00080 [Candidatus Woesebacteria bacterium GWB1_43_5]|uniref:Uncharacterized protein n=1 Tax=Candidatus Woesebacteria bacterium GWB1_43_5 TaxID=1802474 RepID=A0A1F7WT52_9BACT|nr:MAG: hypothetical protein A2125_00080 [Candidatus Woesebacteria bacterium GWB1_43_5]
MDSQTEQNEQGGASIHISLQELGVKRMDREGNRLFISYNYNADKPDAIANLAVKDGIILNGEIFLTIDEIVGDPLKTAITIQKKMTSGPSGRWSFDRKDSHGKKITPSHADNSNPHRTDERQRYEELAEFIEKAHTDEVMEKRYKFIEEAPDPKNPNVKIKFYEIDGLMGVSVLRYFRKEGEDWKMFRVEFRRQEP